MKIYKTINKINGKWYIGKDTGVLGDNYLGSGVVLQRAIKKYGKENFKKEIIEICNDKKHLSEREKYWIKKLDACKRKDSYNISTGGEGGDTLTYHPEYDEICKKVSVGLSGRVVTETHRKNISESLKNSEKAKLAKELSSYKEKQRLAHLGKHYGVSKFGIDNPNYGNKWSDEQRKKQSELKKEYYKHNKSKLIGIHRSQETKDKISKGNLGKVVSQKTKDKIQKTLLKREPINQYTIARDNGTEYIISDETKNKISISNTGEKNGFATTYIFENLNGEHIKITTRKNVISYFESKFPNEEITIYKLFKKTGFNGYTLVDKIKNNAKSK